MMRLGNSFLRHADLIATLVPDPGGRRLVTGGHDSRIRVWDCPGRELVREVEVAHPVSALAISGPDGRIAVGTVAGTLEVRDPGGGQVLFSRRIAGGPIASLAFHPERDLLAAGTGEGMLHLLDARTGELRERRQDHRGSIHSLAFPDSGRFLAAASWDGGLSVFELPGLRPARTRRGGTGWTRALAFVPGTERLLAGEGSSILAWDLGDGSETRWGPLHGDLASLDVDRAGGLVVSSDLGKGVLLWDPADPGSPRKVPWVGSHVHAVAIVGEDRRIALASGNSVVVVVPDGSEQESEPGMPGHRRAVSCLSWGPPGVLASGSADGRVGLWREDGGCRWLPSPEPWSPVACLGWDPTGRLLAIGSWDGALRVVDPGTGSGSRIPIGKGGELAALAWSPDGSRVAVGGWERTVHLVDPAAKGPIWSTPPGGSPVSAMAMAREGTRICVGTWDGTIRILESESGAQAGCLEGHSSPVEALVASSGGRVLVSASGDGSIRFWDLARGVEIRRIECPGVWFHALAVSPEARRLVAGGDDGCLRQWDVVSGQELAASDLGSGWIRSLACSTDGRKIAAGLADSTIVLLPGLVQGSRPEAPIARPSTEGTRIQGA